MYTRYHPIVSAFQKTILLKTSKCASLSCSGSSAISLQFGHPLRRYFNEGSFRYSRQDVPAIYPHKDGKGEIQRWHIMYPHNNEQLSHRKIDYSPRLHQYGHTQGTISPNTVNRGSISEIKKPSGTVTIIIDKADLVVGNNPNEDITIRVTNTPNISSKRLIERLSDSEVTEMCDARCNFCQQCVQLRRTPSSLSANLTNLPIHSNMSMINPRMSHLPVAPRPNPYIPARNYSIEGFPTVEMQAKNRIMENVPRMRKMILEKNVRQHRRPEMEQKASFQSVDKQPLISNHQEFPQNRFTLQKSQGNQMQRQSAPSNYGFMKNPTYMGRTISHPYEPMKTIPQHPIGFTQQEKVTKEQKQVSIEKSRQMQNNSLPRRTSIQRSSRDIVPPIQETAKFRRSRMNLGLPQRRLPMEHLKANTIFENGVSQIPNSRNFVPFKTQEFIRNRSLSMDPAGNRFRSKNVRRSLSAHNQITENASIQVGNQKKRTNLDLVHSPSGPALGKKASFVNQKVVPTRNRFPNENHYLSRIPKIATFPNDTAKEPPRKLRSVPSQKPEILLDSVAQRTNIPQSMPANTSFQNLTKNRQSTIDSKQIRDLSRLGTSMGLVTQPIKIDQRSMSIDRNLRKSTGNQAPNNLKQMRPAPPLHRLKSSFGTAPQIKNFQRNVPTKDLQNLLNKQRPNNLKQTRPVLPMHRLGSSTSPATQDVLKRNLLLNKNLHNLTDQQQPNSRKQLRPTPPLHRLGTSFGPNPPTKNILQKNMSSNKILQNSMNTEHPINSKQNRPAQPMPVGSAPQSRNIPQQNLTLNQQNLASQRPPSNQKQMRPPIRSNRFGSAPSKNFVTKNLSMNNSINRKPPNDSQLTRLPPSLHRFGDISASQGNTLQANKPLNKNLSNMTSNQQPPSNQFAPTPPKHRLGTKSALQRNKTFLNTQNLASKRSPNNSKELLSPPPLRRRETSYGQAPQSKTTLAQNVPMNSNTSSKPPSKNSKEICQIPQITTSAGSPSVTRNNPQRNMAPNRYVTNLPNPNLANVRPFQPMNNLQSSLPPPPKIQNFLQPKRDGSQLLLPPPRPIIQPIENRQCYLQSSLPIRRPINEPKPTIKYLERPKFPLNARRPPYNRVLMKGPRIDSKLKPISLWNKRKRQHMPERKMKKVQENSLMPSQKMVLRSQLRTKVPRQNNSLKDIQIKDQSMVTLERKIPSQNQNDISTGNDNPAVLLCGPQNVKLINTPVPTITDDKGVIIKMLYVHLTDMDAQMYAAGRDGLTKLSKPTIGGKTGCGIIVDVGEKVKNVKPGDKVFVKGVSCGECSPCKNGNLSLCNRVSIVEKLGLLTRFHAHPAEFVTKLPANVNLIDSSMIGELSSAISACKRSEITAGDNVMVIDGSSLGLRTALTAKSMGATNVCLADTRKLVLEQAKKLGIDRVFLINSNLPTSYTSVSMYEYFGGENPRIVFNCNGSEQTNYLAIHAVKLGGKVVLMKNDGSDQTILISDAINRDVDILTSQYTDSESEDAALKFLSAGKVPLNGVNTQIFDLSDIHEAFHFLLAPKGTTNNIFVRCNRFDENNDTKENSGSS